MTDSSGALAGRFVILVMQHSFYGKEDLGLSDKLRAELPGILLWAINGWERLNKRGHFVPPKSSDAARQSLEDLGSPIGAFLRDCCTVGQGQKVQCDTMYRAWCDWCEQQGREHPGTVQSFGRDLSAAVTRVKVAQHREKDGSRHRFYEGLSLDPRQEVSRSDTRSAPLCPLSDPYFSDDPGPSP